MGRVSEKIGICLGTFQRRYGGKQHGDLQASNVFYDERSDRVTFIDVGGMGCQPPEADIKHFSMSLGLLLKHYNTQLEISCRYRFEQGHAHGWKALGSPRQMQGAVPSIVGGLASNMSSPRPCPKHVHGPAHSVTTVHVPSSRRVV